MNIDKLRELLANLPLPLVVNDERELWNGIGPGGRIATFDFDGVAARIEYAVNAMPELLDELALLRKDAERYRWLLSRISYQDGTDGMAWATMEWCVERNCLAPANLDAAIDAAIAAQEGME